MFLDLLRYYIILFKKMQYLLAKNMKLFQKNFQAATPVLFVPPFEKANKTFFKKSHKIHNNVMVYSYIWIIINVNLDNNLTKLIFEFKKR